MREADDNQRKLVIERIRDAFGGNEYPGDPWLQGSHDGCEPFEATGAFRGRTDWQALEPEFLDAHYTALSFFSEAGLRFFLPAYMVADVNGTLRTADPLFHLTHGFDDTTTRIAVGERTFDVPSGRVTLVNPRRYGAATFFDHARWRLSIFTREEAAAIVAYLEYRRSIDDLGLDTKAVDAALRLFWVERVGDAPSAEGLRTHLARQADHLAALQANSDESR